MFFIIAIGFLLYCMLLLFFISLFSAAKRGDEILSKNDMMATEPLPKAPLPFYSSKSLEEVMEIIQKMQVDNKNQSPPIDQLDIY